MLYASSSNLFSFFDEFDKFSYYLLSQNSSSLVLFYYAEDSNKYFGWEDALTTIFAWLNQKCANGSRLLKHLNHLNCS